MLRRQRRLGTGLLGLHSCVFTNDQVHHCLCKMNEGHTSSSRFGLGRPCSRKVVDTAEKVFWTAPLWRWSSTRPLLYRPLWTARAKAGRTRELNLTWLTISLQLFHENETSAWNWFWLEDWSAYWLYDQWNIKSCPLRVGSCCWHDRNEIIKKYLNRTGRSQLRIITDGECLCWRHWWCCQRRWWIDLDRLRKDYCWIPVDAFRSKWKNHRATLIKLKNQKDVHCCQKITKNTWILDSNRNHDWTDRDGADCRRR